MSVHQLLLHLELWLSAIPASCVRLCAPLQMMPRQHQDQTSAHELGDRVLLRQTPPPSGDILLRQTLTPVGARARELDRDILDRAPARALVVLRLGVGMFFQVLVPKAQLTMIPKVVGVALLAASGYICALLVISAHWVFPIPFTILAGVPPWTLCFYVGVAPAVGPRRILDNRELLAQMLRFSCLTSFQGVFLLICPVYSAAFRLLSVTGEFASILVFPTAKFVLKRLLAKILGGLDDLVPVAIISVDLFNALHQAKYMRSAGSWWTTLVIIAIDAL